MWSDMISLQQKLFINSVCAYAACLLVCMYAAMLYLQVSVNDDEGEEGDGCVEADVDGDGAGLAVKHHEAPWRCPVVLQDLEGQSEQQQEVGHQQVDEVDAGAPLLHEFNHTFDILNKTPAAQQTIYIR